MRIRGLISGCCLAILFSGNLVAGASDLADAAMNKDAASVRNLLTQKVDVNAPQADGATALHWAVKWDDLAMTDQLIRAGADVKAAIASARPRCIWPASMETPRLLKNY